MSKKPRRAKENVRDTDTVKLPRKRAVNPSTIPQAYPFFSLKSPQSAPVSPTKCRAATRRPAFSKEIPKPLAIAGRKGYVTRTARFRLTLLKSTTNHVHLDICSNPLSLQK
jgi:hypothetical protein